MIQLIIGRELAGEKLIAERQARKQDVRDWIDGVVVGDEDGVYGRRVKDQRRTIKWKGGWGTNQANSDEKDCFAFNISKGYRRQLEFRMIEWSFVDQPDKYKQIVVGE